MTSYYRLIVICALAVLCLSACSEERKQEAARLAAEMEARERGETLRAADSPVSVMDSTSDARVIAETVADLATTDSLAAQADIRRPEDQLPDTTAQPTELAQPARVMPPIISDGFTVQVESSPQRQYVEGQVELFKQRGYDAYLSAITRPDDQKTYYRVRIGRFATSQEAAALSKELNEEFGLQSWVDKTTFGPATPSGEQPR